MIIKTGPFTFESNLEQEVARVTVFEQSVKDARETVLTAMGVQTVAWAIRDYREKSEGKAAGGTLWEPIKESTKRARVSRLSPRMKERVKQRSKRIADVAAGRRVETTEKGKKRAAIEAGLALGLIGIDTARLINSIVHGVRQLASIKAGVKAPGDGVTNGLFSFQGDSLTIGTAMKYAAYFDAERPIFGPRFIDDQRRKELDSLAEKAVEAYVEAKRRGKQ